MVLNGQQLSSLYKIEPGTLQGSILGLLFLSISNIFMTDSQQTPKKKKPLKKVNKTISFLRKLQRSLLRAPLGTIYKSFMKTYIDYSASSTSLK